MAGKKPIEKHPPEYYGTFKYENKRRWSSYYHQVTEVLNRKPETALEVGIGSRTVSDYLGSHGVRVVTLDIERGLNPGVVGDARALPFKDNSFDVILCCEMLEHVPFEFLKGILEDFRRVARKHIIISVPHSVWFFRVLLDFPGPSFLWRYGAKLLVPVPKPFPRAPRPGSGHKWSIGRRGFPMRRVKRVFRDAGLKLTRTYNVFEHPKHRFFIFDL